MHHNPGSFFAGRCLHCGPKCPIFASLLLGFSSIKIFNSTANNNLEEVVGLLTDDYFGEAWENRWWYDMKTAHCGHGGDSSWSLYVLLIKKKDRKQITCLYLLSAHRILTQFSLVRGLCPSHCTTILYCPNWFFSHLFFPFSSLKFSKSNPWWDWEAWDSEGIEISLDYPFLIDNLACTSALMRGIFTPCFTDINRRKICDFWFM